MVDTLQEILIVAGLVGVSTLWVFSVVGMLHVGWKSGIAPIIEMIQRKRE